MRYLLIVILLAGCAGQRRAQPLNALVGQPSDALARTWGPPVSTVVLNDGSAVWRYGGRKGAVTRYGVTHFRSCSTLFVVDPKSIVSSWRDQCQ